MWLTGSIICDPLWRSQLLKWSLVSPSLLITTKRQCQFSRDLGINIITKHMDIHLSVKPVMSQHSCVNSVICSTLSKLKSGPSESSLLHMTACSLQYYSRNCHSSYGWSAPGWALEATWAWDWNQGESCDGYRCLSDEYKILPPLKP